MGVKNRKKANKGVRPSEVGPQQKSTATKPLVELSEADLRAAGVTFTETGAPRIPGLPVQLNQRGEELVWEEQEGEYEEEEDDLQETWDSEDEEALLQDTDTPEDDAAISAWWDEFFDSMLYTVPFSFLYLMLDIMTNMTYMREPGTKYYLNNYLVALPTIGVLVFYTNRWLPTSKLVQFLCTVTSVASGMRVLWLVNKAGYIKVMEQGPAVGTLWILTIVLLSLGRAVLSLVLVGAWAWYMGIKVQI